MAEHGLISEPSLFSTDAKEILYALRRRKWWIMLASIVVGSATYFGTTRQPKVYEATAQITIEPVLPKVLGENDKIEDFAEATRGERWFYNTQYKVIKSQAVIKDVVARLNLTEDPEFIKDYKIPAQEPDARRRWCERLVNGMVTVSPDPTSRIVKITAEDVNPTRAAKVANGIAQAYMDYSLENRLSSTRGTSKWLDERVSEFSAKIDKAEQELFDFKKANGLISLTLEDRQLINTQTLTLLNNKLLETQVKLVELESKRSVVEGEKAAPTGDVQAVPVVMQDTAISELRSGLASMLREHASMSARYGAKHPNIVAFEQQMEALRGNLNTEIEKVVKSIDLELKGMKKQQADLLSAIALEKQKAMEISNLELEHKKLTRDLTTNRTMYESLLRRQSQADLSGMLKTNNIRWHEVAHPAVAPIRPSVPRNTTIGFLVGLVLGLGITIASVLLDNTVHTQADVESALKLPFLGILPSIGSEDIRKIEEKEKTKALAAGGPNAPAATLTPSVRDLYVVRAPKSQVAECLRAARTNLLFLGSAGKPLRKVLLTSPGPGEGKSTSAVALGITMAQAGNKVVLVDSDLRRPRLHKTFGVAGGLGLTNVLLGSSALEEVVKSTDVVGLDLLPCGPQPPNPAELLHTERFHDLVTQLTERYDRVLLDSPPVNLVTDAAILSQIADGTILVIKASKTPKDAVKRATRHLRDVNANILGVLLNDIDFDKQGYGEYYYYYRRYGYAYGYGGEEKAEGSA